MYGMLQIKELSPILDREGPITELAIQFRPLSDIYLATIVIDKNKLITRAKASASRPIQISLDPPAYAVALV